MKKLILASIILAASQNVMAWGFSDLFSASDDATETVNDTTKAANDTVSGTTKAANDKVSNATTAVNDAVSDTTKQAEEGIKKAEDAQAAVEKVQQKGLTETATAVAKEGGKGALAGAAEGVATGTIVDSGTKGGVDAGKKALSGFGF